MKLLAVLTSYSCFIGHHTSRWLHQLVQYHTPMTITRKNAPNNHIHKISPDISITSDSGLIMESPMKGLSFFVFLGVGGALWMSQSPSGNAFLRLTTSLILWPALGHLNHAVWDQRWGRWLYRRADGRTATTGFKLKGWASPSPTIQFWLEGQALQYHISWSENPGLRSKPKRERFKGNSGKDENLN